MSAVKILSVAATILLLPGFAAAQSTGSAGARTLSAEQEARAAAELIAQAQREAQEAKARGDDAEARRLQKWAYEKWTETTRRLSDQIEGKKGAEQVLQGIRNDEAVDALKKARETAERMREALESGGNATGHFVVADGVCSAGVLTTCVEELTRGILDAKKAIEKTREAGEAGVDTVASTKNSLYAERKRVEKEAERRTLESVDLDEQIRSSEFKDLLREETWKQGDSQGDGVAVNPELGREPSDADYDTALELAPNLGPTDPTGRQPIGTPNQEGAQFAAEVSKKVDADGSQIRQQVLEENREAAVLNSNGAADITSETHDGAKEDRNTVDDENEATDRDPCVGKGNAISEDCADKWAGRQNATKKKTKKSDKKKSEKPSGQR